MNDRSNREAPVGASGEIGSAGRALGALALVLALGLGACENPLDVENPNNVIEENLNTPSAVAPLVNGSLSTTADAVSWALAIHATATDELFWTGSRDAWNQLDIGNITGRANEFTDVAFPQYAEARFQAQKAVDVAEQFQDELPNEEDLARAYFFAGLNHMYLAMTYENFAFPDDPREPAQPVGESNMDQVFDMAIQFATNAMNEAQSIGASGLVTRSLALRTVARHQKAIWQALENGASPPVLIDNADVNSDAQAFLARPNVGTTQDWRWNFNYSSQTVTNTLGDWVMERGEMQFDPKFVSLNPDNPKDVEDVDITDPISGDVDPRVEEVVNGYITNQQFTDIMGLSAREIHLILAEAELAQSDPAGAETHINHVRSMDGQPDYDHTDSGHPSPMEMLQYERMTDLYMGNRRLQDLYRFGLQDDRWNSSAATVTAPGTVFPVTVTECRANPNFNC